MKELMGDYNHITVFGGTRLFFIMLLCLPGILFSQKKKEVKKLGIKTVVSKDYVGNNVLNDSKTTYHQNGKISEEIKYDSLGQLKSSTRYKYNSQDNVIMETEFNGENKIIEIRKYVYNTTGNKIEEYIVDRDNRQIKKHIYTYNRNNLKTERKTFNAHNILISTKKYSYEYTK